MKNLELKISQIQSIKLQLHLLFNFMPGTKEDQLKPIDLDYLAYFICYGVKEGKLKILKDEVSVAEGVWHNKLYEFRKLGILLGKGDKTTLNPKIKINLGNLNYKIDFNVQSDL